MHPKESASEISSSKAECNWQKITSSSLGQHENTGSRNNREEGKRTGQALRFRYCDFRSSVALIATAYLVAAPEA